MKTLNQDAARLAFLFDLGIIKADEVIQWADAAIIKSVRPSYELIEVSTCSPESKSAMSDLLRLIAIGSDIWATVTDSLPSILAYIEIKKEMAPVVARAFHQIVKSQDYTVPDRYSFFIGADDNFDLVDSGIFVFDEVYHDFINDIRNAIH
jgi:hypothetical protein